MSDRPQPLHRRVHEKSKYDSHIELLVKNKEIILTNSALAYRVKNYASTLGIECNLTKKPKIKLTINETGIQK